MLAEQGHKIDLLTYHIGVDVTIDGVNVIRIPKVPFIYEIKIGPSFSKLILDIPLFIKALYLIKKNRYDVIHAHEEAVFFCLIVNLLFKKKYIYDMHSSLPQQLENFNFTKLKPVVKIFEYLEKQALAKASAIITICKDLEEQVKEFGYSEKNELIQNTLFFPISLADDLYDVELDNIISTDGKRIILYAGTFESYQGLDMYTESIKIILKKRKELLFIFLGGNSEQVLELRAKTEELNISDHIIFTGMLEANLVKKFIQKADVLVSPRMKGTNTPLKIYEYMASKVPIVATDLMTHTQELDNECAFLQGPNPESFAKGVIECLENKEEATRRAKNACLIYNKKYGKKIYKQRLKRTIARVDHSAPN